MATQNGTYGPAGGYRPSHAGYAHQASLDDQGIDVTQSPGRESPLSAGSSVGAKSAGPCRHSAASTTSLDSGRASGTFNPQPAGHQQQQPARHSGVAYEACLRNSYHSSSSSLGSSTGCSARIDDIHRLNVCEMLSQGVPVRRIVFTN